MINLTSLPAFGFETSICNAQECYKKQGQQAVKKGLQELNKQMQGGLPHVSDNFIFQSVMNESINETSKTAWKTANIVKILGYIPLIGTLIGLCRALRAVSSTPEELPNKCSHIVRGCIEFLSLGFLLLIPDLILTCYRHSQAKSQLSSQGMFA